MIMSTETTTTATDTGPTPQAQAGLLLGHVAGYMGLRTIEMGLRAGLVSEIASRPGVTPDDLAARLGMDGFYVSVWCRAAFAAGVLERDGDGYRLAPHVGTLLLDDASPAYVGGMFPLVRQPEMLGRFDANLSSGTRLWWDDTSPEWIAGVAATGRPFYTRLVPGGLDQVPGLAERLHSGCRVVDTACGAGAGVIRLATHYPNSQVVGVDGDRHSIDQAEAAVRDAAVADRVSLICSPLEEMDVREPVTAVINNISMHECRDIDRVTENVKAALDPGGWFVISDFPFPDTDDGLLARHGFVDVGSFTLSPVHAVTYGRRPS